MKIDLRQGDCVAVMRDMAKAGISFHACVTDPPYGLTSIVKRFGKKNAAPAKSDGPTGVYKRFSENFIGETWDGAGVENDPETWRAVYGVLKPGAHLLAFGGTRTFYRMACAIEDAGFEMRATLCWLYSVGMPKSHAQNGDFEGWGTGIRPSWEPIMMWRKPLIGTVAANLSAHRTGALNIDAGRMPGGKWPPDVVHDGSEEVGAAFAPFGDVSRFFYCAKASKTDRGEGNEHPTVKPTALMEWLLKMVVPPGGHVLDPFAGSGSTGKAAQRLAFDATLIEQSEKYCGIIRKRLGLSADAELLALMHRLGESIDSLTQEIARG